MSFSRSLIGATLLAAALLLPSGCASGEKKPEEKEKPAAVAPRPVYVGTITLVNVDDGFVLIDGGLLPSPPPNLELQSFTNDLVSGELVSSDVRKRPFVIADIKSGAPQKGDRVFTSVKTGPAPIAPPQLPATPAAAEPLPDFLPPVQLSPGS